MDKTIVNLLKRIGGQKMDVIRILKDGRTILKIVGDKKNPEVNIIETIVIKPKREVEKESQGN